MDTEDAAKTDDFDNCIRFFLAGSTTLRDYAVAADVLRSINSSLSGEWANRLREFGDGGSVLPTIKVYDAESSKEQSVLSTIIKSSDVVLFFLDANTVPGTILQEEMESALGSFLRRGKPYPYIFLYEGDERRHCDGMDEILNQFGFMQYIVVNDRTNYIEYLRELAKIALSVYIEKCYYPKKAVLSRIPPEVGFPNSDKIDPILVNCCMYLCNRLLYTRGLSVTMKKVGQSNNQGDNKDDDGILAEFTIKIYKRKTSFLLRSATVYVWKSVKTVRKNWEGEDSQAIQILTYSNQENNKKVYLVKDPIATGRLSESDETLAGFISGVCDRVATFLATGECKTV